MAMSTASVAATRWSSSLRLLITLVAGAYAVFHLYTSVWGTFEPLVQRGIFIGGGLA